LRGRNRPIVVAWSQGLAAVFTVALLIALLPLVGVYGAAIASTVAYGIALAAMLRCLWRLPGAAEGDSPRVPPATTTLFSPRPSGGNPSQVAVSERPERPRSVRAFPCRRTTNRDRHTTDSQQ
jgi:hypothetical protein